MKILLKNDNGLKHYLIFTHKDVLGFLITVLFGALFGYSIMLFLTN